jgi:uncharacterized protein (DUF1330 family)
MPVYLIIDMTVNDEELYAEYAEKISIVVEKYGGTFLARGGELFVMAGDWHPNRIILIRFDSFDQVNDFFGSSDYLDLAPLREQSTLARTVIIEGWEP